MHQPKSLHWSSHVLVWNQHIVKYRMCGVLEFHSMLRLFFNLQKGLYNFFPDNVAAGSFFNLTYLGGGGNLNQIRYLFWEKAYYIERVQHSPTVEYYFSLSKKKKFSDVMNLMTLTSWVIYQQNPCLTNTFSQCSSFFYSVVLM